MAGTLAKVFGWLQFAGNTAGALAKSGLPHGVFGWISFAVPLASAIAIHAASKSGPQVAQ